MHIDIFILLGNGIYMQWNNTIVFGIQNIVLYVRKLLITKYMLF